MTILTILIVAFVLILGAYLYIRRTPHGQVEFKTGLVLKFIPSLDSMEPIKLRKSLENYIAKKSHKLKLPIKNVTELIIPTRHGDIKARLYNDSETIQDELIIFFHGGGWCIGSIDTHNEITRRLTKSTGLPILSINYSLSPEVKFPIAFEECVDAIMWAKDNIELLGVSQAKFIPMGDSAGGNLSITTTMEIIRNNHGDIISRVVPIYPVTEGRGQNTASHKLYGEGYYLTTKAMANFTRDYLNSKEDAMDVRTTPMAEKDFSSFPPCFVLTAGFDPLRDEGEAFAKRLKEDGCNVKLKRYDNAIHGFFGLKDFGQKGLDAVNDIADYLKE